VSTFSTFAPKLQQAIVSRLGWTSLREVQEQAGAAILAGHDAVILAPTAGGKTEAAMFPILSSLITDPVAGVGALYIAPIKALLNNQEDRLSDYAEMVGLRAFVWHGDIGPPERRRFVEEPAELLLTTPESLEVMLISARFPLPRLFADLRYVVIDEVHAMAGTDRGAHLASVLERIAAAIGHDFQRIGLSATVGNPKDVLSWLQATSQRPGTVVDPPKQPTRRDILVMQRETLPELTSDAARVAKGQKCLFFCQSRATTEAVAERMRNGGIDMFVHHSSVSTEERHAAEARFQRGTNACIVCTSTLELGIDVGDLDRVLQHNAPSTVSSFLQRMGRTGRRAGQVANTTFLCESAEAVLQAAALVELTRGGWVEDVPINKRCWPVLVHQLLAMTLQHGQVTLDYAWPILSRVPDFRGFSRADVEGLVAHMAAEGFLLQGERGWYMGEEAERVFGRRNFMELYAVFSSPVLYRVQTLHGQELGQLEQAFVDQLVEQMSSFLLAGRAWTVAAIDHPAKLVKVAAAPAGRKPSWGGFMPQVLSRELCQKQRELLATDDMPVYLHPTAQVALESMRTEFASILSAGPAPVLFEGDKARWWTFAGGKANQALAAALGYLRGWNAVADNWRVRIEGTGVDAAAVSEVLAQIEAPGFWQDPAVYLQLLERLPQYRLSKFQRALPAAAVREMVGEFLLDLRGGSPLGAGQSHSRSGVQPQGQR
jgi:ATP-dependent Lhr-like helicase